MYLIVSSRIIGSVSPAHSSTVFFREEGRHKKTSNVRRLNSQRAFRGLFQTAGIWAHVTSSVLMPFLCCFFAFTPWIPPSERSTLVLSRLRADLKTVTQKQPSQEHTRSSLFSVNFSIVLLLFNCTLSSLKCLVGCCFSYFRSWRQSSVTQWKLKAAGLLWFELPFGSVGIDFNVASACRWSIILKYLISEVPSVEHPERRVLAFVVSAWQELQLRLHKDQCCVTGLISITAKCMGASGKCVMFIHYTTLR